MKIPFKISDSLPYILLPISCMCFDEALKISWINGSDILRAFCDSSAHGVIAFLSWLAVSGVNYRSVAESIMCAVIACAIDFDHFAMAESYNLQVGLSYFILDCPFNSKLFILEVQVTTNYRSESEANQYMLSFRVLYH